MWQVMRICTFLNLKKKLLAAFLRRRCRGPHSPSSYQPATCCSPVCLGIGPGVHPGVEDPVDDALRVVFVGVGRAGVFFILLRLWLGQIVLAVDISLDVDRVDIRRDGRLVAGRQRIAQYGVGLVEHDDSVFREGTDVYKIQR